MTFANFNLPGNTTEEKDEMTMAANGFEAIIGAISLGLGGIS